MSPIQGGQPTPILLAGVPSINTSTSSSTSTLIERLQARGFCPWILLAVFAAGYLLRGKD
jgi:hypothetical protein